MGDRASSGTGTLNRLYHRLEAGDPSVSVGDQGSLSLSGLCRRVRQVVATEAFVNSAPNRTLSLYSSQLTSHAPS